MTRLLTFAFLLCASTIALADDAARMHELATAHRQRNGLPVQALDAGLCRLAQRHAEAQAASRSMWHSNYGITENVANGYSVDGTIAAWVASSGHNANLLSRFSHCGFGYSRGFAASLHGRPYTGPDRTPSPGATPKPVQPLRRIITWRIIRR